jgi:hypothetical protein
MYRIGEKTTERRHKADTKPFSQWSFSSMIQVLFISTPILRLQVNRGRLS